MKDTITTFCKYCAQVPDSAGCWGNDCWVNRLNSQGPAVTAAELLHQYETACDDEHFYSIYSGMTSIDYHEAKEKRTNLDSIIKGLLFVALSEN